MTTALPCAEDFDLPGHLAVQPGRHQQPCLDIDNDQCRGRLYLLGATVTDWQPAGHQPVLFTSRASHFAEGKPIRGGVPICFPWFGPHPHDADAPAHGVVRTRPWNLIKTALGSDGIEAELVTHLDHLHAGYRVTFGRQLRLRYTVTNTSDSDQTFEAALHTYLAVGDAAKVDIAGLEGTAYVDKTRGGEQRTQGDQPVAFTAETDRVYLDTQASCILTDPVLGRRITVEKQGSHSTVIWNPWIDKAARMEDFGDEEWKTMCCIETANVGRNAITLAPGGSHTMSVTLGVNSL